MALPHPSTPSLQPPPIARQPPSINFTLISSEGDRFQIRRTLLTEACAGFADVLGAGVDAATQEECKLVETTEHVKLLVDVLKEDKTEKLTKVELQTVAELSMKYQSRVLHLLVQSELVYLIESDLLEAFDLASILDDAVLGELLAKKRVAKNCNMRSPTGQWNERYSAFRQAHLTTLRNTLLDPELYADWQPVYDQRGNCYYEAKLSEGLKDAVGSAAFMASPGSSVRSLLLKAFKTHDTGLSEREMQSTIDSVDRVHKEEVRKIRF